MTVRQRLAGAALLALAGGCSSKPATSLTLSLRAEPRSPSEIDHLAIRVTRDGREQFSRTYLLPSEAALPGTLSFTPESTDESPALYEVGVRKGSTGDFLVMRRARLGFVKEKSKLLRLTLEYACAGVACPDGQTCVHGACASDSVDPETLPDVAPGDPAITNPGQEPGGGTGGASGAGGSGTAGNTAGAPGSGMGGLSGASGAAGMASGGMGGSGGSSGVGGGGTGGVGGGGTGGMAGAGGMGGSGGSSGVGGGGGAGGSSGMGGMSGIGGMGGIGGSSPTGSWPDSKSPPCSDGTMVVACTAPGDPLAQDGSYPGIAPSYVDGGDGTVTDLVTGLVWQKNPPDASSTWSQADAACKALPLGPFSSGWRLPTRLEMVTISDYGMKLPAQPAAFFSVLFSGDDYWTSSAYVGSGGGHWGHNSHVGYSWFSTDTNPGVVYRCVHGALTGGAIVDLGPVSFFDPRTGLEWQKAFVDGQTWTEALDDCESSTAGGKTDWRLPNIKELATMIDEGHVSPAADPALFPGLLPTLVLYSSTPDVTTPGVIWTVEYIDGQWNSGNTADLPYGHRCVR